ncbi:hypothetical protein [Zooshikella ganghwensis]|uniref:hypothetical protein n=1 Tax=Zooshikella ganghwensis TaxID=202772 RepID=UPI0004299165|nr:hypothetical protein [Zooshikella ganghwensis]
MKIYEVPEDRRYWVVRANQNLYYDHFTRYGVIAVGHFNTLDIKLKNNEKFFPDEGKLKSAISRGADLKGAKKAQESKIFNQLKNFIYNINIGDWVVTIRDSALRFGIVESDPYIDNESLEIFYDVKGRSVEMDYMLRRKVTWGPTIHRKTMPYGLVASLGSQLTVFNIDKHWEAIYHSLYPAFSRNDELFLSLKIRAEHEIKNYSVVQILQFMNEIEVISKEFESGIDKEQFETLFSHYVEKDLFTLTTKAQFNSPGDIWNKIIIPNLKKGKKASLALLVYAMLFGNNQLGMDGVIDLETRQKLWDLVIHRMSENNIAETINKLELSRPTYDTSKLEKMDEKGVKKQS